VSQRRDLKVTVRMTKRFVQGLLDEGGHERRIVRREKECSGKDL